MPPFLTSKLDGEEAPDASSLFRGEVTRRWFVAESSLFDTRAIKAMRAVPQ